jgi:hypothetical protein
MRAPMQRSAPRASVATGRCQAAPGHAGTHADCGTCLLGTRGGHPARPAEIPPLPAGGWPALGPAKPPGRPVGRMQSPGQQAQAARCTPRDQTQVGARCRPRPIAAPFSHVRAASSERSGGAGLIVTAAVNPGSTRQKTTRLPIKPPTSPRAGSIVSAAIMAAMQTRAALSRCRQGDRAARARPGRPRTALGTQGLLSQRVDMSMHVAGRSDAACGGPRSTGQSPRGRRRGVVRAAASAGPDAKKLGFIGLGIMGAPMVGRARMQRMRWRSMRCAPSAAAHHLPTPPAGQQPAESRLPGGGLQPLARQV